MQFISNKTTILACFLALVGCGSDSGTTTSHYIASWSGDNDTEIEFPADLDTTEFYRSTNPECDLSNYSLCDNGQMNIINGDLTDQVRTLNREAYYSISKNGKNAAAQPAPTQTLPPRIHHQAIVFKGKMWVIGGSDNDSQGSRRQNDIWSSTNGSIWTKEVAHAAFSAREFHQVVEYKEKLWLFGGIDDNYDVKTDVWSSEDAVNWKLEAESTEFDPRYGHKIAVFNDRLWMVAGTINADFPVFSDVWVSDNATNWTEVNADAGFYPRYKHSLVAWDNKLWMFGGEVNRKGDSPKLVWSTVDGVTWTEHPDSLGGYTWNGDLAIKDNKLWLASGSSWNPAFSSSVDGLDWESHDLPETFKHRYAHQLLSFEGQLWVIGGYTGGGVQIGVVNDVWRSADGSNWRKGRVEKVEF